MNKQGKLVDGKVVSGIEWLKTFHPNGTETQGYTWNPVSGCHHDCRWLMPDGSTAICYAENVAEHVAQSAYPQGFKHHYWNPDRLVEPLNVKRPSRIFVDSMADLMGAWVPDEQIEAVLDVARRAHWHTFLLLTKNAPRLMRFEFPPNVWVGVSAPPTHMLGRELNRDQQLRMIRRQAEALRTAHFNGAKVTWMSIEPLSFNIAPHLADMPLNWAVIGAATNGAKVYQPDPRWVNEAIDVLRQKQAAIFFKGNLAGNAAADPWLEEYPA